jgi:uncharacterized protein YndB with AHSA1/START domain
MNGRHQLRRSIETDAPREVVWSILEDSSLLAQWAHVVQEVTSPVTGPESVGAVRDCRVDFGGRQGTIVERCVELVAGSRIGYVVDRDSLGFNKMFADYGFTISLEHASPRRTRVVMNTYYTPRNAMTAVLNVVVMRRKFRTTVDGLLDGLARLAEEHAATIAA